MARQIKEQQFNVEQASRIATQGSAFDDSGVRLAESLSGLVSDLGQFGEQLSGMYAQSKQEELRKKKQQQKEQQIIDEKQAYDDIAKGLQQDPKFLAKHDNIPEGWTEAKWTAYNEAKGNYDAVTLQGKFDQGRENYLNAVANDPNRVFIQGELDTVYQNIYDQALRNSNASGAYMQAFLPKATSALQSRATADRADRAARQKQKFESQLDNSIFGAVSDFDFSQITPQVEQKSTDYFVSQGVRNPTTTDTFNYARADQIFNEYQRARQIRKDLGLEDKDSIVTVFKQLASQDDDLTPVMEILLDMEMPGTGLTLGESGQRVKLLEVFENAREDRSEGTKNSVTVRTSTLINDNKDKTRQLLLNISESTKVSSLVPFHNALRTQNEELNSLELDILLAEPENKTELLQIIERQRSNNKNLISRGNGVYFASENNPAALSRIYTERMLGTMSDQELFDERKNLTVDQYEEFLYMQDELQDANNTVVRAFVKLLGVDPGQKTLEEMMSSRFFKPGSAEAIALNSFTEKLAAEGTGKILKYYNAFGLPEEGKAPTTIQTKLLNDDDTKELYDNVQKARAIEKKQEDENLILYRTDKENFYQSVNDPQDLEKVYKQLGNNKERQQFLNGLNSIQRKALNPYLDI